MPLERLRIEALRCLTLVECELHPRRNYIYGPNGAGKTSLLEAIYLLGRGRSFRGRQARQLIQRGRDRFSVYGELRSGSELRRLGVGFGGGELEMRIDRRPAGIAEAARVLRVDVIDPSVHRLIEGGPSERRRFLDWGVFHVEQDYLSAWRRYRRALGQRNAALKQQRNAAGVQAWTALLLEAASEVDEARCAYVEALAPLVATVGEALAGRPVEVEYRRGWRAGIDLATALVESRDRDASSGFTQVGPHRADLQISFDRATVGEVASRGQQKLVAAALVVAQVRAAVEVGGRETVLLVDDPAAELDSEAVQRLDNELRRIPCQLVLTGLSERQLPPDPGFPVFHVKQGTLDRCYTGSV